MTLQRRSGGRGRWIAAAGAVVILAGCLLPWYRAGGADGIPALTRNAFEGAGILVFLAALATVALVALPYALREGALAGDPWWVYLVLGVIAAFGLAIRLFEVLGVTGGIALVTPDRGPGTWLVLAGIIAIFVGAAELFGSRER